VSQTRPLDSSDNPVILIIEDDLTGLYLWQRYTLRAGLRMVSANSMEEAVNLTHSHRPVLVVLDFSPPSSKWKEILRTLKSNPVTKNTPVWVCSAVEDELLEFAKEADGYLRKPVLYVDFLTALISTGVNKFAKNLGGEVDRK